MHVTQGIMPLSGLEKQRILAESGEDALQRELARRNALSQNAEASGSHLPSKESVNPRITPEAQRDPMYQHLSSDASTENFTESSGHASGTSVKRPWQMSAEERKDPQYLESRARGMHSECLSKFEVWAENLQDHESMNAAIRSQIVRRMQQMDEMNALNPSRSSELADAFCHIRDNYLKMAYACDLRAERLALNAGRPHNRSNPLHQWEVDQLQGPAMDLIAAMNAGRRASESKASSSEGPAKSAHAGHPKEERLYRGNAPPLAVHGQAVCC